MHGCANASAATPMATPSRRRCPCRPRCESAAMPKGKQEQTLKSGPSSKPLPAQGKQGPAKKGLRIAHSIRLAGNDWSLEAEGVNVAQAGQDGEALETCGDGTARRMRAGAGGALSTSSDQGTTCGTRTYWRTGRVPYDACPWAYDMIA